MSDYRNQDLQFVNLGLNLRDAPDKLQDGQWRRLTNVRSLSEGSLTSRPGRIVIAGVNSGNPVHTLLKLGSTIISGAGTVLYRNGVPFPTAWNGSPLSWVRHRGSVGEEKWLYATDGDTMEMMAADGSDIKWGITSSTEVAVPSDGGSGVLNSAVAGAIVYDWRYTYFNSRTGAESNPSPEMTTGLALIGKSANVQVRASVDGQVDTIKLYRRGGVNGGLEWRFVTSTANPGIDPITNQPNTVIIQDNQADSAIALSPALLLDNFVPFTSVDEDGNALYEAPVPYIWGPLDGKYLFGCGDPNRPGHVYWTNPGRPHSSDVANHIAVTSPDEPLMGGFIYGGQSFVWSRENLYALDFGGPDAVPVFTPRKTYCGRGLSLPFAFAIGPLIWFFSKDGIYVCDGQSPAEPFTESNLRPLFNPQVENRDYSAPGSLFPIRWPAFSIAPPEPTDSVNNVMRMNFGGQYLHAHYIDTADNYIHLLNHLPYNRWSNDESPEMPGDIGSIQETLSYFDEEQPNTELLIGLNDGRVALETGTFDYDPSQLIQCRARMGSLDFGLPQTLKELGNVILDIEVADAVLPLSIDPLQPSGISMIPFLNAETSVLSYQRCLGSGTGRQKIPRAFATSNGGEDPYCYSLALDFEWNGNATIFAGTVQWHPDEEYITRWEHPPTTHGLRGYQQVRDIYLVLRGTGVVTPTVEIDGTVYPLTADNGNTYVTATSSKQKFHLWCPPTKGKLYRWSMSGTQFRLYGSECEIRLKEFCTGLGYQVMSPFALE